MGLGDLEWCLRTLFVGAAWALLVLECGARVGSHVGDLNLRELAQDLDMKIAKDELGVLGNLSVLVKQRLDVGIKEEREARRVGVGDKLI